MLPVICQTMYGIRSTILALPREVAGDTRGSGPQREAEQNRLLQPNLGGGPRARRRRALGRLQVEDAPSSRCSCQGSCSATLVPLSARSAYR